MAQSESFRLFHRSTLDDYFRTFGFASGRVELSGRSVECSAHSAPAADQSVRAPGGPQAAMVSVPAHIETLDTYELVAGGACVALDGGAMLFAKDEVPVEAVKGKRIALASPGSTEGILAETFLPAFTAVRLASENMVEAVQNGDVFAALIVDDNQGVATEKGLSSIDDLVTRFAQYHDGAPLPLSVMVVQGSLDVETKRAFANAYRESIRVGLEDFDSALAYAVEQSNKLSGDAAAEFVRRYVHAEDDALSDRLHAAIEGMKEYCDIDFYAANGRF